MKICHILSSMSVGGMERVVDNLLRAQSESDCEAYLFCTDTEGEFYQNAAAIQKHCAFRKPSCLSIDIRVIRKLIEFLRANKIEVVHAHNHLGLIYGGIAAIRLKIPFVVTMHGQGVGYSRKARLLERFLMTRAAKVVAVSEDAREVLIRGKMVSTDKVVVISNGIDVEKFRPTQQDDSRFTIHDIRASLGISSEAYVIGAVGRLAPEKNYSLLVEAFAQLSAFSSQLCLLIVGDGPERECLEERARSLGLRVAGWPDCSGKLNAGDLKTSAFSFQLSVLPTVFFAGMQEDIGPWYEAMDVFCLPSLTEGMSMTLLEAGAAGLPSVVTDVGGNAEIVEDGVAGLVIESEDTVAMAKAFERLYSDSILRKKMGENARGRIASEYSTDKMVQSYRELYEACKKD